MASDRFFVSVIVPVFNGEAFLAEAVDSIRRQAYEPLEIIVVDDGSTDGTRRIVSGLGGDVKYVYQANSGPAAARNKGLTLAQGNVIAFLDADDRWPDDKLRLQLSCLAANPSVEIVQGHIQIMRLTHAGSTSPEFEEFSSPLTGPFVGSTVFRKRVFDTVGLFDETLRDSEDVDWFVRAREHGLSTMVLEPVTLFYRVHESNLTYGRDPRDFNTIKILKQSMDRRRRGKEHG